MRIKPFNREWIGEVSITNLDLVQIDWNTGNFVEITRNQFEYRLQEGLYI